MIAASGACTLSSFTCRKTNLPWARAKACGMHSLVNAAQEHPCTAGCFEAVSCTLQSWGAESLVRLAGKKYSNPRQLSGNAREREHPAGPQVRARSTLHISGVQLYADIICHVPVHKPMLTQNKDQTGSSFFLASTRDDVLMGCVMYA